jgi:high-affinity iron transporter
MLAALIIVFRESMEAGLVIGIVLAATQGVFRRGLWVTYGIIGGMIGACTVAVFARELSAAMAGLGQELFNAIILSIAVVSLSGHNVWMSRHGREMGEKMKALGEAVTTGSCSLMALAVVVGIAVLREGSEVVLFLYGIAIAGNDSAVMMLIGGVDGLALGALISVLMYLGLLRIPTRHLFKVTSFMLALLAAGMAAQAIAFYQQADIVNAFSQTAWNSSALLSEASIPGKALHTLIGYTDRPTVMQLIVYGLTLVTIAVLMRLYGNAPALKKTA